MRKTPLQYQQELVEEGRKYASALEFEKENMAKYLMARRQGLLKFIYPVHTCAMPPNYASPVELGPTKVKALENSQKLTRAINTYVIDIMKCSTTQELEELTKAHTKVLRKLLR